MAETAKQTKKTSQNKNFIAGICAAIVVVAIIVVAVILINKNNKFSESYFVSDGTKYVLNLDEGDLAVDENGIAPIKAHIVYYYSGDNVTGIEAYYKFADSATAQRAYNSYKESGAEEAYKEIRLDNDYIVMVSNEADYDGLTTSAVKEQIDFMEQLKNSNNNTTDTAETTIEETPVETTVEVVEEQTPTE